MYCDDTCSKLFHISASQCKCLLKTKHADHLGYGARLDPNIDMLLVGPAFYELATLWSSCRKVWYRFGVEKVHTLIVQAVYAALGASSAIRYLNSNENTLFGNSI